MRKKYVWLSKRSKIFFRVFLVISVFYLILGGILIVYSIENSFVLPIAVLCMFAHIFYYSFAYNLEVNDKLNKLELRGQNGKSK